MQPPTRTQVLTAGPWVFIALIFIACGSAPRDTTSPAPAPAATETAVVPAGPGMSATSPAPIGTSVEPAKGWTVSVVSADTDADAEMSKINPFNTALPGNRLVLVQIAIRNGTNRPAPPMTALKFSLLANGVAGSYSFHMVPAPRLDLSAQLQPGATTQGWVPFQAPVGVTDVVLLVEPFMTLDQMDDQRFFAVT
jgi:hypothetical protein